MATSYGHIAFEGLIGAGKTTLCKRVADSLNGRLVLEEFDDNPFLPRFYEEPERFAFSVELSFLAQRYHQLKRTTEQSLFHACTVADYSIGKSLVFARVTLQEDEFVLFRDLYTIMYGDLPRPDLLVYLHLPMDRVRERIALRGRGYERTITADYLTKLQEGYLDHLHRGGGTRVVVLDLSTADLLNDPGAYDQLLDLLREEHPLGCTIRKL
jgi:deoxyadenosine/deoxycytidine kinase